MSTSWSDPSSGVPTDATLPAGSVRRLLALQDGVVARRQVLESGLRPHDVERLLRRREWRRLLPGVYVDHTGEPTWLQRAWAGVLHHWPAALAGASAMRAVQGPGWRGPRGSVLGTRFAAAPGAADPIEVVVDARRTVTAAENCIVTRSRSFDARVQWNASPPRIRFEEAVLDVATRATRDVEAIGVLADACQSRRTTAARLLAGVEERSRVPRRDWLVGILADVAKGTCSALEHAHLTDVVRAHGLPQGVRQSREEGVRLMFRDVLHADEGVIVELDGRLFHGSSDQRAPDLERDLDAALGERITVRLGWGQCTDRACTTAVRLAQLLQRRGWSGEPAPCGRDCPIRRC